MSSDAEIVAAAMAGSASSASAGKIPRGVAELYGQLDVDQDGRVSRSDAAATGIPDEEFLAADQDGDGFLDLHEFMNWLSGSSQT
jgi:Ca2+-binding EF-hand superfamily protein